MSRESGPASSAGSRHGRRWIARLRRENYRGTLSPAQKPSLDGANAGKLEELEKEKATLQETVLRARAEFDNFRKRVARERDEANKRAGTDIISELLPVLDNFARAVEAAKNAGEAESVVSGVEMIHQQFRSALMSKGLEPIEALNKPFDPNFHEAVAVEARDDVEDNRVVAVLQDGFTLSGRLIRPAMVRVAKKQ
jgi:molecular chaperone GrpE